MSSCPGTAAGNVKAMGTSRFAYDALSRLTEGRVRVGGSDFVQEVEFDAFGNITEVTTSTFPPRALETSTSTNHLTYGTYNPAGSLTSWNLWSYAWDPVEMMKRRSTDGQDWRHVYTAGDERFWSVNRIDWETSDFALRDLDGRVLRVYEAGEGKWSRFTDYVWRGDALLARDFSYTRPEAFHLDHLGTPRLLTNHRAERLAQPNYYPFGEELTVNTQVAERLKFTGHERDTLGSPEVADDLDYMHARFANPITGRFLSVDRAPGLLRRPQMWNRYSYVSNNPLVFRDPDGNRQNPVTGQRGISTTPERGTVGSVRATLTNPRMGLWGFTRTNSDSSPRFHAGVDINARTGLPIFSAETGRVTDVGVRGRAGNRIQITMGDGTLLTYAHLDRIAPVVALNASILEGTIIGYAGTTGNAQDLGTADQHLHFSITDVYGNSQDPLPFLNDPFASDPLIVSTPPTPEDPLGLNTWLCSYAQSPF